MIAIGFYCFALFLNMPFVFHPCYIILDENKMIPNIFEVKI